jgi:glycine cleavage system H protein
VNDALNDAPETINSDPYGEGWLFEVRLSDPGQLDGLLHSDAYAELVSG